MKQLNIILDFMYTGELNVAQGDTVAVIKAAEKLQVKGPENFKKKSPFYDLKPDGAETRKRKVSPYSSTSDLIVREKRSCLDC